MFFQLLLGKFVRTQTSITENSTTYKSKNDRVSYLISLQLCAFDVMRHLSVFQTYDLIGKVTHWRFNGRMFLISQGGSWTLIDVPGHESLRVQIVEKYKAVARWVMKNEDKYELFWLNSDCMKACSFSMRVLVAWKILNGKNGFLRSCTLWEHSHDRLAFCNMGNSPIFFLWTAEAN